MFNEYWTLDYTSFEYIVSAHCKDLVALDKTRVNEITGKTERVYELSVVTQFYLDFNVLLPAGLTSEEEDDLIYRVNSEKKKPLGKTFLCKCRKDPGKLPRSIRTAYLAKDNSADLVKDAFDHDLIPLIHGEDQAKVIEELLLVIKRDDSIPKVYREKFKSYANKDTLAMFLAKIFVYVMTQDIDSDIIALKNAEKSHPEINPLIKRTVDEIKQFGRSSYYLPVLELLCAFAEKYLPEFSENIKKEPSGDDFTLDDIIYFIEGSEDLYKTLTPDQRCRFEFSLMVLARTELSRRYLAEYEKASNQLKGELLRKYHLYQTL